MQYKLRFNIVCSSITQLGLIVGLSLGVVAVADSAVGAAAADGGGDACDGGWCVVVIAAAIDSFATDNGVCVAFAVADDLVDVGGGDNDGGNGGVDDAAGGGLGPVAWQKPK